ncbi:MAG: hypothetical protein GVY19_05700 [Bacteroidetes bacterium]|jgi:hypothetical protein|nr:hypothetical protein [Bacteroidota bacterium]
MVAVENIAEVITFKKIRILYHVALAILLTLLFFSIKQHTLQMTLFATLIVFYVAGVLYVFYAKPSYFRMAVINDNEIQLRFFKMHYTDGKKKAIQFHAAQLQDFKIQLKPFKKYNLILTIKTNNRTAQYPPISISLLNKKQREFLASFLEKIVKETR